MVRQWLNRYFHKSKALPHEVEYEEIIIRLADPIPPASSGAILNNRDWRRAVDAQRQRQASGGHPLAKENP